MLDQLERHAPHLQPYTELRLHQNHQSVVVLSAGSIMQNAAASMGGASARSYSDGAFGFASLPSLSDDAIPTVLEQAAFNADLLQRRARRNEGDLPDGGAGTGVFDYRSKKPAVTKQEEIDLVRAIDAYLRGKYGDLVNVQVVLQGLDIEKALVTSMGASTYSFVPRTVLQVQLMTQASDGIVSLANTFGGFGERQEHLVGVEDLHAELDTLYEELKAKAEGVYCTPGEHDVILDSDLAGILAHEAIGHTCEADLVLGGSIAGDHIGDLVASEKVTLIDYAERGADGNGGIAIHVDDEGTPCRDVTLIENGVLRELMHNKETAREMDATPTGNARAWAFNDEPLVRMRNTCIVPGTDTLDDMIGSIDRGYYFKKPTNGQADSTSEFMFGVGCGYEIVDGKLGRAVRDTTIAGVAFDMLKTITHVSDDMTWSVGGMCGKKQPIPVGMGGPAVKCRIGVGGRADS